MQTPSDNIMIFDEISKQLILTEQATLDNGIQLRARLSRKKNTDPTSVIMSLTRRVSNIIYNYLHQFSLNNMAQNEFIASNEECRYIVYRAMIEQLEYMLMNGDLSRSPEISKRQLFIDESAKQTLNTVISSIGIPLTYTGVW